LGSMLFKKKGEFLKVLNHILNRGANNCGGHCISRNAGKKSVQLKIIRNVS